jgi:hypothetical protein
MITVTRWFWPRCTHPSFRDSNTQNGALRPPPPPPPFIATWLLLCHPPKNKKIFFGIRTRAARRMAVDLKKKNFTSKNRARDVRAAGVYLFCHWITGANTYYLYEAQYGGKIPVGGKIREKSFRNNDREP